MYNVFSGYITALIREIYIIYNEEKEDLGV